MTEAKSNEHRILTKGKVLSILKKVTETDNVDIVDFTVKPGTEAGDNYSSEMTAVDIKAKVNGMEKDFHWMVKVAMNTPDNLVFIRGLRMEETEVNFYKDIIPAWKKLIKERNADIKIGFANCLYTEFHEDPLKGSLIVMENMQGRGFRDAVDKKKGLNLAYVKLVMEELAKLHALAYVQFKSYPGGISEGIEKYKVVATDYAYGEPDPEFIKVKDNFAGESKKNIANVLEAVQVFGQDFAGAYQRFDEEHCTEEYISELVRCKYDTFKTLCHGDLWFNNMLFR